MKEHLLIGEDASAPAAVEALRQRLLAFSMSMMPRDRVFRCELVLRAGKNLHAFVGKLPTPEFYGLLQALSDGEELEFIGLYEYEWEDWWEESTGADPYSLESIFLPMGETPNLFYSMFVGEDKEPGEMAAFGEKNGRKYRGVVSLAPLSELPDRGRWFAPTLEVSCTQEQLKTIDIHSLLPVCRRLCSLGGKQELYFAGHSFHFSLRGLELHSREQLEKYFSFCRELKQVTAGRCCAYEELVDLSAADPRMLVLQPAYGQSDQIRITML